jgi:signal transduction histidine kinase
VSSQSAIGSREKWLAQPLQATLDAFQGPVAILSRSGEVVAANAAWRAGPVHGEQDAGIDDGAGCVPGDNYLDWCRTFADEVAGAALAKSVKQVLAGAQKHHDQTCRILQPGGSRTVRVRIGRIERHVPSRFVLLHDVVATAPADDVEERVLAAQMRERERLATELHDSVGQNLVCLGLNLTRLRRMSPPEGECAAIIGEMAEALQLAHAEIRTLSFLLHPPWPELPGAFQVAVRQFVEGFARRAGLSSRVDVGELPGGLCSDRELTLFRILQEALVNIHRHAKADFVEVELAHHGKHVTLKIHDNGCGMGAAKGTAPGVGILGMRARLEKFGGDLRIISSQSGTTVAAKLPVGSAPAALGRSFAPR